MQVLLELSATSFNVVKLVGIPVLLAAGSQPLFLNSTIIVAFVDIQNQGNLNGVFEVNVRSGHCEEEREGGCARVRFFRRGHGSRVTGRVDTFHVSSAMHCLNSLMRLR